MLPLESLHGAFQSSLMVSMVAFRSTIEARKRIWDEICNFSVVTEPGKTAFARSRKTYMGKIGGLQDGVVIGIQLPSMG